MTTDADTRHSEDTDDYSILSGNGVADNAETCIRVGRDYQALIPAIQEENTRDSLDHKATLLWIPCRTMTADSLESYIRKARDQFHYTEEQALGMLLWHRHSVDRAVIDLANFTQRPDDWLVEEKAIFRQGIMLYNKRFDEIQQQLLRERRVRDLIEYYYTKYKLDRAHKLQLNQQKLNGGRPKKQTVTTRRTAAQNGSSLTSNWSDSSMGNGTANARDPQSPQVRNLLSFLSPAQSQSHAASTVVVAPHLYRTTTSNGASRASAAAADSHSPTLCFSYYNFVPISRRIKKPRGLQLELGEMREIVSDLRGVARGELETLQREYDNAERRLDELRRTEQNSGVSPNERTNESRKLLLARFNRDVLQVRDRMHFSDSVGLLGRRTTQRWSQSELVMLQTILKRNLREDASATSNDEPLNSTNPSNANGNTNGNGSVHTEPSAIELSDQQSNGSTVPAPANHAESSEAFSRRRSYKMSDTMLNQLMEVFTSKNATMIETYVTDKLRTLDVAALRVAAAAAAMETSDTPTLDEANGLDQSNKKWPSESTILKRPCETSEEDVMFVTVTCPKKSKLEEVNGH